MNEYRTIEGEHEEELLRIAELLDKERWVLFSVYRKDGVHAYRLVGWLRRSVENPPST